MPKIRDSKIMLSSRLAHYLRNIRWSLATDQTESGCQGDECDFVAKKLDQLKHHKNMVHRQV